MHGGVCSPCPDGARCPEAGTTLETIDLLPGWWRLTNRSSRPLRCEPSHSSENARSACLGGPNPDLQCQNGTTGPLCRLCAHTEYYFDEGTLGCRPCVNGLGALSYVVLIAAPILVLMTAKLTARGAARVCTAQGNQRQYSRLAGSWLMAMWNDYLYAKLKLMIGFYQVLSQLQSVYGAKLPTQLSHLFSWTRVVNFDLLSALSQQACIGSFEVRLWLRAGIPLGGIALFLTGHILAAYVDRRAQSRTQSDGVSLERANGDSARRDEASRIIQTRFRDMMLRSVMAACGRNSVEGPRDLVLLQDSPVVKLPAAREWRMAVAVKGTYKALPVICLLVFTLLPGIASNIFQSINCVGYEMTAQPVRKRFYLLPEPSMTCWSPAHRGVMISAASLFVLWCCGVTVGLVWLLHKCRVPIMTRTPTPLSRATRFLHSDYKVEWYWWEMTQLIRKMCASTLSN